MTIRNALLFSIPALSILAGLGGFAQVETSEEVDKTTNLHRGALTGDRYRVLVSTDIGGTDPDDFQSMVHLLVYADSFDIEGLVSSPYGPGREADILKVIDAYEEDYPNLKTYSDKYPAPNALRALTKQGETEVAPYTGVRQSTEGSEWLIACARRKDPRPLYVLVWGGIEDLAQALYDAPDILPRLRVYWIGGPNKKWSPDAYQYIADHHPELWIIEANATYRGWFTGGRQSGKWGNKAFVTEHIAGRGALGDFFNRQLGGSIKMGDTPSVAWLLDGMPEDPTHPGWGGQFVRAWERPHIVFDRLTTAVDRIEQFSVFELVLPLGDGAPANPEARMQIENQSLLGSIVDGKVRFRFSPKAPKPYDYTIKSNAPALNGQTGRLTAVVPSPEAAHRPAPHRPNWWTDDPSPAVAEGPHIGARTVSRWRQDFLEDFATRMARCQSPAPDSGDARFEERTAHSASSRFAFEQQNDRLVFTHADKPVAHYVFHDETILRPYFANVHTPDGIQATRDHPPVEGRDLTDHATMHPGIWIAFGDISGHDFWRNEAAIRHERFREGPVVRNQSLTFATENTLVAADGTKELARLDCQSTISLIEGGYLLSWDAIFMPSVEGFFFGDQEEMGFGVRVATKIAEKNGGVIRSSGDSTTADGTWGEAFAWCDYSGMIDGRAAGITVMAHPENFRPSWFHNRDYGLIVANPFGRRAFGKGETSRVDVPRGDRLRLRWAAYIHDSVDSEREALDGAYRAFAGDR